MQFSLILILALCNGNDTCCTSSNQCDIGEGDCDYDQDCADGLICGTDNCPSDFPATADCCVKGVRPIAPRKAKFQDNLRNALSP